MAGIDRCIRCGGYVPEGRFVCHKCENEYETKHIKKERETSIFTIYSQRLAGYLMMNGFTLLAIVKNDGSIYNNFLFANTDELHNAIAKWQKK